MALEKLRMIKDLEEITKGLISRAEYFRSLTNEELNFREEAESWSILECLEHLNRYGEFYLVEIEKRMLYNTTDEGSDSFKPGWLGNYFVGLIKIKDGQVKKIKTLKDMNPLHSELNHTVIDKFIKQQKQMIRLLDRANNFDLTSIKTNISINKWIKIRLGDTFRFVIYHNQRHVMQADRVLAALEKRKGEVV